MLKRSVISGLVFLTVLMAGALTGNKAEAAPPGQPYDWGRFYYYPYVYYPHNFTAPQQYDNLYYRYPQERQIPVYNANWHNFYLMPKPYHMGHFDILDVF